jgi:hypothetical protein
MRFCRADLKGDLHDLRQDEQNPGDCYTFVASERHSKQVLNIAMGKRDQATTDVLEEGMRRRSGPVHISRSPRMDSALTVRPSQPP